MTRTETGWTVDFEDFEKRQKTLRCSFSAILIILGYRLDSGRHPEDDENLPKIRTSRRF